MIEGKTKQILPGPQPGAVILRGKDVLTGGDAARVADIVSIGAQKTTQAVNVFALLAAAGVPTAFIRQLDERSMLCWDCDMLPIEFVVRRFAWGSYLLRHPTSATAERPQRFDEPIVQMFHKHAAVLPPATSTPHLLDEGAARAQYLRDGVWAGWSPGEGSSGRSAIWIRRWRKIRVAP
jgi:phosphoribosylaminoimidazole-succinocarboxamide synthase